MSETTKLFLHQGLYDEEFVITSSPTSPGRYESCLGHIYRDSLPGGFAKKLADALPLRMVVPASVVPHAALWACSVEFPRLAKKLGV